MEAFLQTAQTIGVTIAQIILTLYFCIQYIEKHQKESGNIPEEIKKQNKIDMDIIKRMDYYKELLNADRVLLFEFHNGQHYSNFRSALKMSASYEVYKAGLTNSREACTNIPIQIMPKFIQEITNNDRCFCHNIEEIKGDMGNSYEFKKSLGIQSFYDVAIHNESGNTIGFVAVQWNNVTDEFNELEINHLAWYLEEAVKELTKIGKKKKTNIFSRLFKKGVR